MEASHPSSKDLSHCLLTPRKHTATGLESEGNSNPQSLTLGTGVPSGAFVAVPNVCSDLDMNFQAILCTCVCNSIKREHIASTKIEVQITAWNMFQSEANEQQAVFCLSAEIPENTRYAREHEGCCASPRSAAYIWGTVQSQVQC